MRVNPLSLPILVILFFLTGCGDQTSRPDNPEAAQFNREGLLLIKKGMYDEAITKLEAAVDLSPDNTEAKVTYLLDEGPLYTLTSVRVENDERPGEPLTVFSTEQIAALLEIKTGDVYSQDKLRKSKKAVKDAYGVMGYLDAEVFPYELRSGPEPRVDLRTQREAVGALLCKRQHVLGRTDRIGGQDAPLDARFVHQRQGLVDGQVLEELLPLLEVALRHLHQVVGPAQLRHVHIQPAVDGAPHHPQKSSLKNWRIQRRYAPKSPSSGQSMGRAW